MGLQFGDGAVLELFEICQGKFTHHGDIHQIACLFNCNHYIFL